MSFGLVSFIYFYASFSFSVIFTLYTWHDLLEQKINYKNKNNYIFVLVMTLLITISYYLVNSFLRVLIMTIVLIFWCNLMFRKNVKITLILPVLSQLILLVAEVIISIFLAIIFAIKGDQIISIEDGRLLINFIIILISFIILKTKIPKKIYALFLRITNNIRNEQLVLFSLIIILFSNILFGMCYYKIDFIYLLIFNTGLIFISIFIVFYSLTTKNKYNSIYNKYNTTLSSLKEYEDILNKYKIRNHEFKNQLLTISNMVDNDSKQIKDYVKVILKNELKDDEKLMNEVIVIPPGGLRGLIYSKLLTIKSKNIKHSLYVSKNVKTVDLINILDSSTIVDICQIIGVYIDNAIDEASKITDSFIKIDIYIEKKYLYISVSNSFISNIEIEKIDNIGYTTKGENRGYGLSLTRSIIEKNLKLSNQKKITGNVFTQVLKIKM